MKIEPLDWVELLCLGAIGAGAWVAWGLGEGLMIVGGIGLLVALCARVRTKRKRTV